MFRVLPRPSSGAYNCISSLWFYRWSMVVAALLVVVWQVIFLYEYISPACLAFINLMFVSPSAVTSLQPGSFSSVKFSAKNRRGLGTSVIWALTL